MNLGHVLADQMDGTRDWTLRLLADFDGDDWGFQPAPGLAHALWICGHVACSQNLLVHVRVLGRPGVLAEDFARHFPIGGPVRSVAKHDYPDLATIRRTLNEVHAQTLGAVSAMSEALLAEPAFGAEGKPHPHYHDKLGAVCHCARHEAFHAGQLATLRRLRGKSFLR